MKNKRILFVLGNYYPKPYANAICAKNIINLYLNDGYVVDIVCIKSPGSKCPSTLDGANLSYVEPNFRLRMFLKSAASKNKFLKFLYRFLGKIMSVAFRVFCFPWLPRMSLSLANRYYRTIKGLTGLNQYDGIVSFVNPIDGALGVQKIKKKDAFDTKWIVYCIDTLTNSKDKNHPKKCYLYSRFLKYCDKYIAMKSNKNEYSLPYLKKYENKIVYSDLPVLVKSGDEIDLSIAEKYQFNKDYEHWSYFGSIGGKHYSYVDFLDFYFALPNDKKRILHLFTRGNDIKYNFDLKVNEFKKVVLHGYVGPEIVESCLKCSDVLVSIKYSNVISAKYFQYISYGKKIVHFSGFEDDPDVQYLKQYNNVIILKTYILSLEEMIKEYLNFKETKVMNFGEIKEVFITNTPEFSKEIIDKAIN